MMHRDEASRTHASAVELMSMCVSLDPESMDCIVVVADRRCVHAAEVLVVVNLMACPQPVAAILCALCKCLILAMNIRAGW